MVKSSAPIPIPGATAHHNHQPIDDNQEKSDVVMAGTSLSRSFTFESSTGVRRKIPVTPVLSTGAQRRNSQPNQHHDTLHYRYSFASNLNWLSIQLNWIERHGTLVFPGSASSVIGKLTLDLTNNNNTTTTKISNQNAVSVIPLITTNASAGTVSMDGNLLKLCQDGDAGSLSRYLSHHHDQVPCRSLNLADPSGKVTWNSNPLNEIHCFIDFKLNLQNWILNRFNRYLDWINNQFYCILSRRDWSMRPWRAIWPSPANWSVSPAWISIWPTTKATPHCI